VLRAQAGQKAAAIDALLEGAQMSDINSLVDTMTSE